MLEKWLSLFQLKPWFSCLPEAFLVLLITGCGSSHPLVAAGPPGQGLAAPSGGAAPPAARSQADDDERTGSVKSAKYTPPPSDPNAEVAVRVRAQVNGVAILDDEIREACYPQLMAIESLPEPERGARRAEILLQQLQQIIDREIILQDMMARVGKNKRALEKIQEMATKEFDKRIRIIKQRSPDVKTDEDIKKKFQSMGLSLAGFKRQVEREFMARAYMQNLIFDAVDSGIGHQQILEYYQQHPDEFQRDDRVQWQDIFVDKSKFKDRDEASRFAEQLAAQARAGQDFLKLAAQYDSANYAFSKGEGLGQRKGEIRPTEVESYLFQMREGQVGPVVELATGFHIFRLAKREFAGRVPLDEKVQKEIRKKLQAQIAEREWKWAVNDLKKKARIEIMGD
jgi:parvulin-like peptidyl-prolyl isomerase